MLSRSLSIMRRPQALRRAISSLCISPEVQEALSLCNPVVALESTIISHGGLPYPRNLELALDLENAIREEGATPATCAVIDGVAHVGLTRSALEEVANRQDVMKASRRDLAYACAMGKMASTTVAGTMILAHAAGIKFFATGGIGGVHRGAENTFDISADLLELGKTPVVVVSAGVKSILDIPKTLEVLETNGVPVLSLGSDTFPAFFTHGTIPSPRRVDSEADVARMVLAGSRAFGESTPLETGMVVAVPNPMPYPDAQGLEECIKNALANADKDGIEGAAITPYILGAINKLTGGDSLTSNIALVTNNAKVAARIATEHSRLLKSRGSVVSGIGGNGGATGGQRRSYSTSGSVHRRKSMLVVGGSAVDSVSNITAKTTILNSSNPAVTRTSFGGVGRNIAEKLGRLTAAAATGDSDDAAFVVSFASVVAADAGGLGLVRALLDAGVDTDRVTILPESAEGAATATYTAIHGSDGDLVVSAGDFRILEHFTEDSVLSLECEGAIAEASVVVVDGNFSPSVFAALARAVQRAKKARAEKGEGDNDITAGPLLFFEPTSDHKCTLPIEAASNKNGGGLLNLVDITKPNISELVILLERAGQGSDPTVAAARGHLERGEEVPLDTTATLAQSLLGLLLEGDIDNDKHVVVSLGGRGAVWASSSPSSSSSSSSSSAVHVPLGEYAVAADDMHRLGLTTNGCGDAFCAALVLCAAQNGGVLSEDAIVRGYREAHRQITNKV